MKKFLFLLLGAYALINLGCSDKRSTPNGGVIPPAPAEIKITLFAITPTATVHFTGLEAPASLTATWATVNAASAKLNGNTVALSGSQPVAIQFVNDTVLNLAIFDATGNKKAEQALTITATIDANLEKLSGKFGKSYKLTAATGQAGEAGIPYSVMTTCLTDDIFTFYPNCTNQTNYGTDASCPNGMSNLYHYKFNSSDPNNMVLQALDAIPAQPDRRVEFTSATTMKFTYTYNGVIYKLYYVSL